MFWAGFRPIWGSPGPFFGGCFGGKIASDRSILSKKFRRLGLPPQTPPPDSEQLAGAELLHTCAHPRNLAFEMPGNRNGASDRGGDKHCDDHSRAWGWRGACPERLEKLQAVDEQLSNDTLNNAMDCFKNKKPELGDQPGQRRWMWERLGREGPVERTQHAQRLRSSRTFRRKPGSGSESGMPRRVLVTVRNRNILSRKIGSTDSGAIRT